jgi:hypothetical protein
MVMCLSGAVRAQTPSAPAAVMSQVLGPSTIGSGSALAGSNVAGTSMGLNSFGDLFYSDTYGNHIYEFPASGWMQSPVPAPIVLASVSGLNPGGVAVDKSNNLYINFAYNSYVMKVPYIPGTGGADGTYATISAPDGSTPACTGSDTAECLESNANPSGSDSVAMVFDAQGDLFITTRNTGTTPNAIYECPASSCLDAGTNAATMVYQEPTTGDATTQLSLGDVAVDAAGNVFFTDSVVTNTGNNTSTSSNLKEITYTSGSGYASTPTTIYAYTPASPGGYDSETTGVAAGPNNIIYLFQLGGGILAFPDSSGAVTEGYVVSTQTAKAGAVDAQGNLYTEFNNGSEVMAQVLLNPVTAPATSDGNSTTANFTTLLNDGSACSSSPTVTYSFAGSSAAAFAAATNTGVTCGSTAISGGVGGTGVTIASGSSLGGTLTFTPTIGGISSAAMTATDDSGNSGTANVAGSATGTLATPSFSPAPGAYGSVQTVIISSASGGASIYYTTDGTTPSSSSTLYTAPLTVGTSETLSAIAIEAGDTTSGIATGDYTINVAPTGPPDFSVPAGTYSSPQTVSITSSTPGAVIYYTLDGSTPTTSSAVYSGPITVSSTETITAFAQAPGAIASDDVQAAYTINLPASAFQNVVISQNTALAKLPSGGALSGGEPAGDTMAVDSNGDVIMGNTYGNQVLLFPVSGAAPTVLGTASNTAGVALDAHQNLFIAFTYGPIVKIPYTGNETWAAIGAAQPSNGPPYPVGTPNCTGNDAGECIVASASQGGNTSVLFDAAGDMFYGTSSSNGTNPNAIFMVPAASLYSGTQAGTLLFQEPTSSSGTTTGQLEFGGMALDASGDVFFTDSAIDTGVSEESFSSNLNELPVSSTGSTGYASTPTPIYSYTVSSPGQYDAEIDGVAVGANGTVYALVQNTIGVLAFPDNNGSYSSSTAYLVSPVSGKLLAMDQNGNFFVEGYSNALSSDAMNYVALNNITATAGPTGNTTTATNLVTVLNDGDCSSGPAVTFTTTGTNAGAFSAATSGSCSAAGLSSAQFATTLSFTPTAAGINTATLTATDTAGNSGGATVVGNATGTLPAPTFSPAAGTYTTIQTVAISDAADGAQIYYTTDGSTPNTTAGGSTMLYTGPISVIQTETINAIAVEAGDTTSSQASAAYTLTIPATATPAASVPSGTYGTPQEIALSDSSPDAEIHYTTDGSQATSSSPLYTTPIPVTGDETINAIATSPGAADSAMATFTYTISLAPSAYQAVVMNQQTQLGSLPSGGGAQSGQEPEGDTIAINSFGDVLLGDTYGGKLSLFTPQGTMTTLGSLSNVQGTAVDSQNNLYVGWAYSGSNIVKLPYISGSYVLLTAPTGSTPACTGNDTAECTIGTLNTGGASVVSMLFDPQGDLIYATANSVGGGGTNNTIFKMPAAALYSGGTTPTVLYSEPTAAAPDTTGQLSIGGLALDAAGDIFFTDSAIGKANNQESFSSNVNELPLSTSSSTGYASAPTVIYTHTPTTPGNYDDEIDGVAVAPNGTVYFIIQNQVGIEAIPQSGGVYDSSQIYLASSRSGKLMSGDAFGNLYAVDESGNVYAITVDNITVPGTQVATPASQAMNVFTVTNDTACGGSPAVTFAISGTNADAFTAATTGSCSSVGTSSGQFATTVTFNPSSAGGNAATLTATDSNGGTGAAEVSAVAAPATQAVAPSFTPPAGDYTSAQTVTLTTTTPNASIYYTTDGTTPATTAGGSTMLYSGPITVSTSETIEAIATAQNVASSAVATAVYTLPAATPTFSPGAGTYTSAQTVTIASTTPNAQIFYTLDGSNPAATAGGSTMAYTGPITVGTSETVNAIATATGFSQSSTASAVYAINLPPAAAPTFSVSAGTYTTVQSVSLADTTPGASIYYTVDGTTPATTAGGSTMLYSSPITVGVSETVNATAVASGYSTSPLGTAIYVINLPSPSFTTTSKDTTINVPASGSGTATVTITTNATFNAQIAVTCSGYLPLGDTCSISPATLTPGPSATVTSTVSISSATTTGSVLRGGSGPLLAGTMLAGALALFGLRKRRRLQMMLMLVLSVGGFSLLNGCGTTPKATAPTSSQIIVTATAVVNQTKVISTIPFIVTTQQ